MKEEVQFVVYRETNIDRLGVALFVKKTSKGYKVACPREELDITGSGNMVRHVGDEQFVALVDKRAAASVYSVMSLLGGQYRAVKVAARKAMIDAVDRVAISLQKKGNAGDKSSENCDFQIVFCIRRRRLKVHERESAFFEC